MHNPNTSMVKCIASFSFLLLSLGSIFTVLWVYPPQKEYRWAQWFQRGPAANGKVAPAVAQPAEIAVAPKRVAPVVASNTPAPDEAPPVAAPAARTVPAPGEPGSVAGAAPTQFKVELESAMKLVDTGKPADAVPILNKILEKEPTNEMALVELAMIQLLDFKDPAASVPLLERALRVNPGNQVVMSEMLGAYEEMGQPDVGTNLVQQMYEEKPSKELANAIGKSLLDSGDPAKALTYLADGTKDSKDVAGREQYARALAATGAGEEAVEIYRSNVEIEKENQKSGVYASEPDQGKEKIALAQMAVVQALIVQDGAENKEAAQELLLEIEAYAKTDEAKADLAEKFRRKNMN